MVEPYIGDRRFHHYMLVAEKLQTGEVDLHSLERGPRLYIFFAPKPKVSQAVKSHTLLMLERRFTALSGHHARWNQLCATLFSPFEASSLVLSCDCVAAVRMVIECRL